MWSSGQSYWLQIQKSRVWFPALPDYLRSSGSGTGSTQPREDNWGDVRFVVDEVALGQVFSEYFGFLCQFSFHRLLHIHHHISSGAGAIGQLAANVPSGLSLTPPQETNHYASMPLHCFCKVHCLWDVYQTDLLFIYVSVYVGARGSVVGWGTMLQAGRSRVRVPMRWIFFQLT
jgi:hypothetical protein